MKVLAVDLGGTHAKCALVEDRRILASQVIHVRSEGSLEATLPALAGTMAHLISSQHLHRSDFHGIAIGFCGLVDRNARRIISTNSKYEHAPGLDLQTWARQQFDLPLWIENDARMALLGEWHSGAAEGVDDAVMVTLGTGIGGAALIGGRLLIGKHFQAGCLGGHFPVCIDGRRCTCGAFGCPESEAAGWSLPRTCRGWPKFESSLLAYEEINFQTLFRCADAGDAVAVQVREYCLKIWAVNAVALIHAYDPEILVYGGGVMRSGDMIVNYVQQHVNRDAWTPWGKVRVCKALLGDDAGLLGSVPLIEESERSSLNVR